jgi:predicted amidohydrolase YtcJ
MNSYFIHNGWILNPESPDAPLKSLLIQDGFIQQSNLDKTDITGLSPQNVIDLNGRSVLPGLIDSHLHLRKFALNLQRIDCETQTKADCLERVELKARVLNPGDWILGHGWNQNIWTSGYGTASDLDKVSPDHPTYLTAKSLHASWVNSAALKLAGIDHKTSDPPGGTIGRDEKGQPTGILYESAVRLVEEILPIPGPSESADVIEKAQLELWKMGLTGVHDFDRRICFSALQLLEQRGKLGLRVLKSIPVEALDDALEIGLQTGFGSDRLWIGGVKIFADGALGPQTAAMLAPYQGSEDQYGMLLLSQTEIEELARKAVAGNLALAVHAIGDRANREVLNALESTRKLENQLAMDPLPHRIEHVQCLAPADTGRLGKLDIIASMQPIHATSDMEMADRFWGNRTTFAYAPKTQLEAGALLIFGSDAPVESPNPFYGIHAAVTRQTTAGNPDSTGWNPAQRLTLQESLIAYTRNPARAAQRSNTQGIIQPGAWADLIVLDQNPFDVEAEKLAAVKPAATMVGGEWVFRNF